MTNRSNSFWRKRQTINGLKRKEVEIALKRYVAACERDVQAFIDRPTAESLEVAKVALDTFLNLYTRWILPHLESTPQATESSVICLQAEDAHSVNGQTRQTLQVFLRIPNTITFTKTVEALDARLNAFTNATAIR